MDRPEKVGIRRCARIPSDGGSRGQRGDVAHAGRAGRAPGALDCCDHIRNAPVIRNLYGWAEKGYLDPYQWLVSLVGAYGSLCTRVEHGVSWVYDKGVPGLVKGTGNALSRFVNGRLSRYLYLVVVGLILLLILFFAK